MTSKQHDTHKAKQTESEYKAEHRKTEPEHKKAAASTANEGALTILRAERTKLDAFANSPEASKSGESIEAHAKVAFLDGLIAQIEATSS